MRATVLVTGIVIAASGGCVRLGFDHEPAAAVPRDARGAEAQTGLPDLGVHRDSSAFAEGGPAGGGLDAFPADQALADLSGVGPLPGWTEVPAGSFWMGSPTSESCMFSDEVRHEVILSRGFQIQLTEVTQQEFSQRMGYSPAFHSSCGPDCPVERVSWYEAAAYCNALSGEHGLTPCYSCQGSGPSVSCASAAGYAGQALYGCPGFRLPFEAEWEYAYRAGTVTAFYNGPVTNCWSGDLNANQIGWYGYNSNYVPHPVGQKLPNPWGLLDMAGNVWEWCQDWYQFDLGTSQITDPVGASTTDGGKVIRGGAFNDVTNDLRAARRYNFNAMTQTDRIGFRCVRSAP